MYFLAIFCSLYIISVQTLSLKIADIGSRKVYYNISDATELFDDFIQTFNKHYDNIEEYNKRFDTFVENLKDVNERNRKISSTVFGITPQLDLTEQEILARYSGARDASLFEKLTMPNKKALFFNFTRLSNEIPQEWDWRTHGIVTPIKDQGDCGSCWAFGSIACIESQYAKKYGRLVSLSEQQILDCTRAMSCDGGLPLIAFLQTVNRGGVMTDSSYPYQERKARCRANPRDFAVNVIDYHYAYGIDENDLKRLIYEYGPVTVSLFFDERYFSAYKSGVARAHDMDSYCGRPSNHAVAIVGYGEENNIPYWIIKNSHGVDMGEGGFIKLERGVNACGVARNVVYVDIS